MSKLKQLMVPLDPRTIIAKTETPHDQARASITLQSIIVQSYAEFEDTLIAYIAHHTQMILGTALPIELCLDKARKFLDSSIGWDNAVYIAMSGSEGGVPNILNQINDQFKQESKQAYFSYYVDKFIDPLNFEEVVFVMAEIKEKLGAYSPESFGYISAESMAANYKDILWKYVESISRHRNLWSYQ